MISRGSYTFSFAVENLGLKTKEITLNCTQSRNLLFSDDAGKLTRLVEPGCTEFFLHAEATPGAKDLSKSVSVASKDVY